MQHRLAMLRLRVVCLAGSIFMAVAAITTIVEAVEMKWTSLVVGMAFVVVFLALNFAVRLLSVRPIKDD